MPKFCYRYTLMVIYYTVVILLLVSYYLTVCLLYLYSILRPINVAKQIGQVYISNRINSKLAGQAFCS